MSNFAYYLLWLAAGLVLIAVISAVIARQLRQRVLRQINAVALLEALHRNGEWIATQRQAILPQDEGQQDGAALLAVRALRQQWFPELRAEGEEVFAAHARLVEFLTSQQELRLQDPEAWLLSDHDARFMELWRQHLRAVQVLTEKLKLVTGTPDKELEPRRTFPA